MKLLLSLKNNQFIIKDCKFFAVFFCLYENLAIVARFRGALAVSVERNKKILTC